MRQFGVEIECINAKNHLELASLIELAGLPAATASRYIDGFWTVSSDATIQGSGGTEVISPPLLDYRDLATVVGILNSYGCKVDESCGLHIHWSVNDFSADQLKNLLRLYARYETVIGQLVVAPYRQHNRYCKSLRIDDSIGWIDQLGDTPVEMAVRFKTDHTKAREEYSVNILSLLRYGTVEFRQHEGTLDLDRIVAWIQLTGKVVEQAKKTRYVQDQVSKRTEKEILKWMQNGNLTTVKS